jgi:pimeloyl-ACP methyl ester carboxylesterase
MERRRPPRPPRRRRSPGPARGVRDAANALRGLTNRALLKRKGGSWRTRLVRGVGRWRYADRDDIDRAVEEAGQRLGIDLDAIDVAAVAEDSRTCILLLHGALDRMIPATHSRRIAAASPRADLYELPDENHFTLPLRVDWLAAPINDWLDALSTDTGAGVLKRDSDAICPRFALPADPARPATDGS